MNHPSLYITGTDTGVGKTAVTAALLRGLVDAGFCAVGMKPLASGCAWQNARWENEDALALQAAAAFEAPYALINPIALPEATAPEIAARKAGMAVELGVVKTAHAALAERAECVLVEGVGGWLAPLSDALMQVDLVRALRLPAVLVVGLRLGCINHALLTLRALRADGVEVLGWIGSAVDPTLSFATEYRESLLERLDTPCLGLLEHAADRIDIEPLRQSLGLNAATADAG